MIFGAYHVKFFTLETPAFNKTKAQEVGREREMELRIQITVTAF
jgi:hypothetical protein